jgi:acetylornithine/LysW-gamma-L-lysine aminotransferase
LPPPNTGPIVDLYPNRGLVLTRGEGAYLFTRDGRRFLDLMTNYGANLLGHAHPDVTRAIAAQLATVVGMHGSFGNDVRSRASVALLERLPMPGGSLYWGNSGTEAVEAAIKFAVAATGRLGFIAATGGYHGKTLGALALTHAGKYRALFDRVLIPVRHVSYGSVDAVAAAIDTTVAAVIVEPIQGESGVVVPPDGYLRDLRTLCSERGVLLVVDEIQTGGGRTGSFTVAEREGIEPDLLCLGKGLAGGLPVGITAVAPAVAEHLAKGLQTSTFGGNPLVAAGVLATLAVIDPPLLARVATLGDAFRRRLTELVPPDVEVRGRGLMVGVAVGPGRDRVLKSLQERGILAIPAGDDVVRFLPPLTVTETQLEEGARGLAEARTDVAKRAGGSTRA